jgi:hypothetical protein
LIHETSLLSAVRTVIRADSDPVRRALFANLTESHLLVRLVFAVHEAFKNTVASTLLVSSYGLGVFLTLAAPRHRRASLLSVARHVNARRQVARITAWLEPGECEQLNTRIGALAGRVTQTVFDLMKSRGSFIRAMRVVRRIDDRHGFLVACRAAAAIAWYARGQEILHAQRPYAIVVSSDTNPEEVGFTAAARALGIPTIFISHAYPTPFSPPLAFNLSILGGQAEADARRGRGASTGEIVLAGLEGESKSLNVTQFERREPVIGIFAPKAVSWATLAAVIADCRQYLLARQIVIRWHPSMLEPPRLSHRLSDMSGIVESPKTAKLADVARMCDWVIADENSSVHLPVLKLGIPSIAVKQLGRYPETRTDMYGLVRDQIVPPAVASIRDMRPETLAAFFSNGWAARFQQYDASYARPQEAIDTEVRAAIQRLRRDAAIESIDA